MPDVMRALLETRAAFLEDLDPSPGTERLLLRSDLTGTMQLYEQVDGGAVRQLTALSDPVAVARYVPGARQAVIEVDATGDERHQLFLLDLGAKEGAPVGRSALTALTAAPEFGHHLAGVSPSGDQMAYLSNRRNGVDFDLWVCDLPAKSHRVLYAEGGWCQPGSGYSPDGRFVSVLRPGPRPLDTGLLLVDSGSGDAREVLPHPDEAAEVGAPAWAGKDECFVAADVGRDHACVFRVDVASGSVMPVEGTGATWDATPYTSRDGSTLLVVENRDGASHMRLFDAHRNVAAREVPTVEPGVVVPYGASGPRLAHDGARVYYSLTTPRRAGDLWCFDRESGETRRLTSSPSPVLSGAMAPLQAHRAESFDEEVVPVFVFRPDHLEQPPPVVVVVHGGPEAQAVQAFNPVVQGLVASGYGVVVPNVRGSTGYGKRYASLDDRTRRLDSVHDLAAVHAWLSTAGFDDRRAALWGGSYGGYMVLAGLAFQPDLWAAGVDIVGISDLVTFLEHTSDYRRAHREREYGSLEHDRAFLESASPLRRADEIRAPLFVVHGRNDPRVPLGEAEQLAARLRGRGVRCELSVYDDEGHGLARLSNRVDAYTRAVAFLDDVLRGGE